MSKPKSLVLAGLIFALSAAGPASAQVFVIGNGLGGECYSQTKDARVPFRAAENTCTLALREDDLTRANRAATYVNRGVLRMRNGLYDSALADYADAILIEPTLGAAYLNQGAAYIYKKEYSSALTALNRAVDLNSADLFAAHYNRAIARENTGDLVGAYQDFRKALDLKPGWELAQSQLSRFTVTESAG